MRKRSKRTPGIEEAHPFAGMSKVNPNAAGVDIGAVEIIACVAGENCESVWQLHSGLASDWEMAERIQHKNCSHGKHGCILDPAV